MRNDVFDCPRRAIRALGRSLGAPVGAFLRRDDGAFTIMFAIWGSVIVGTLCMAIDSIHYSMSQTRMQMALDVATLSAGADLTHYSSTTGASLAQWQADALAYFNANMPSGYLGVTVQSFTATLSGTSTSGQTISLNASGAQPLLAPYFLGGTSGNSGGSGDGPSGATVDSAAVNASNAAERLPPSVLEVVMVLDNTGSMADPASGSYGPSKMAGLQAAANALVSDVFSQGTSTYYVGLVPFASTVNVKGALSASGSWMNASFAYNNANVQMNGDSSHPGWGGCPVEPRDANGYLYPSDYAPSSTMKFTPYYYNVPQGGLTIRTYSNGFCRSFGMATRSAGSVPVTLQSNGEPNYCGYSVPGTGIAAVYDQAYGYGTFTVTQNSDCISQAATFLTNSQSTLTTAIGNMTPGGSTIIPVGLLWGWRMLDSTWSGNLAGAANGWISTDASLPKPETTQGLQRVMIVLTDGENQIGAAGTIPNDLYFNGLSGVGSRSLAAPTVYRADGASLVNGLTDSSELHDGSVEDPTSGNNAGYPDDVNTFQSAVCTAIKNAGITVYAITFGDSASSSVAQTAMQSCASPGNYYHAPDNATLNSIFQQIAGNLGELRLVK
jgi:Flp pilus assembly protein TadG